MTTVDQAYSEVERLTRARARNFAYGIMLLPKPKRRAIAAVYAFAREVDDIADDPALDDGEKRKRLEGLRARIEVDPGADAMLVALADARRRYAIPARALHDLIDGGLQDTEQRRYATFGELHGYCRRVAGAVGVACVAVYGTDEPKRLQQDDASPTGRAGRMRYKDAGSLNSSATPATEDAVARRSARSGGSSLHAVGSAKRAETLAVALQLINIIRDVREDWELGRVYLPQDELAAFDVTEEDIACRRCTDEWRALMAHEAARARELLAEGRTLLPLLDRRSAACVAAFANLYAATLDRIEERGFDVFAGRPHLSSLTKIRIAGSGLVR